MRIRPLDVAAFAVDDDAVRVMADAPVTAMMTLGGMERIARRVAGN